MNVLDKRDKILKGNLYEVIVSLSLPIMINNLIQTLYNLADGIWVSKISSVHFAATAFVFPVAFLFISLGIGISIAGTSILSQLIGASDYDSAKDYATQITVISLIVSILFAALGYILSPFIIKVMGAQGSLAEYSIIYLKITFLDMPFTYMFFVVNSIMNAQGNMVIPTILSGISAILNIILDPVFIFTFNMGIAGAAIATLISKAILAFAGFYILMKSGNFIKPCFKNIQFNKRIIKKIYRVGLPSSVGQSGAAVGFIVLNSFIASYGTATIAAFGMVNRITALIMQPAMGVGAALTSIIGQNIGSNQISRAKEAFIKSLNLTISFSVIGCIMLLWKNRTVINFFMQSKDDITVISQGITYLNYITVSMPLMGIFSVLQGFFQGTGHTRYSMAMEIGRLWFIRLPMILFFKYFTGIGPSGIWFSMSFSNLLVCIYGYLIYRKGLWQYNIIRT